GEVDIFEITRKKHNKSVFPIKNKPDINYNTINFPSVNFARNHLKCCFCLREAQASTYSSYVSILHYYAHFGVAQKKNAGSKLYDAQ
ncbi:MAG: hypothetical protein ACRC31_06540, partial [Cetobacterium sp.]